MPALLELMLIAAFPVSPNGLMFVKHDVRKSLLSKMLSEILDTRVMVKSSMALTENKVGAVMLTNCLLRQL